jgi:dGTPase
VKMEHGALPDECRRYFTIRTIIDRQIHNVVETSERLIRAAGVSSADDVRCHANTLIRYSPERRMRNIELRRYLYKNLYLNRVVNEPHHRARQLLRDLFQFYLKHPGEIGGQTRRQTRRAGLHRVVCDYIAGMTDRYAIAEHQKFFGDKLKFA